MAEMEHGEGSSSTTDVSGGNATLELKIKTLDSRIFTLQVDKDMAVSAFKEKVASESGVTVGLQRLIFRGKVLKDDHLLSEYHVENGDTLHLVERQPQPAAGTASNSGGGTTSNGNAGQDFGAGLPRPRYGQISHSVVLGSLNLGEPGEAAGPDIGQVIGGILNSFGIGNLGGVPQPGGFTQPGAGVTQPGSGVTQPGAGVTPHGVGVTQTGVQASHGNETQGSRNNGGSQNQSGNQSVPLQGLHGQFAPHAMQIPLGGTVPFPTLNAPIPDSLDTLVEFMSRMELALSQGSQPNQSTASTDHQTTTQLPRSNMGLPTVEALSILLSQAQRLLSSHVVPALSHTAGRLDQEGGSTDPSVRGQLHTESAQLGVAMQHMGALLLELGRTMLTLRMGQSPAESFVNAGPAVYISPSGPNPIMVQPFPLQTSSLFGGVSGAPPNSLVMGPIGGTISRNVNIHIHTGGSLGAIIPRGVNGAHNREGTQGQSTGGSESFNSGQAPGMTTSVPLRPAVVPVSGVMPPGTSAPHASSDSNSIPSIVAQINSHLSRQTPNLQTGNNDTLGHSEGSNVHGQSAGGVGDSDRNSSQNDLPTGGSDKEKGDIKSEREISNSSGSSSDSFENLVLPERPNKANNPDSSSSGVPLGLGLGGLQPKKRVKQPKGQTMNSDNASTSIQNTRALGSLRTGMHTADTPVDMADAMSQFLEDPAMNGLLSGVAQQTGVGSPDMLRNMLQQFTQNPAMRNTVNQIAQQLDSSGGLENMMSGMGGGEGGGMDLSRMMQQMMPGMGGGGEGGGMDLSRMMQQMMPVVAQTLGGGFSAPPQITGPVENVLPAGIRSRREAGSVGDDPQMDLGQVLERIENQSSSQEIFRSVGENVVHFLGDGHVLESAVNDLCSEGGLAQEFAEMLKNDITGRFRGEMGS